MFLSSCGCRGNIFWIARWQYQTCTQHLDNLNLSITDLLSYLRYSGPGDLEPGGFLSFHHWLYEKNHHFNKSFSTYRLSPCRSISLRGLGQTRSRSSILMYFSFLVPFHCFSDVVSVHRIKPATHYFSTHAKQFSSYRIVLHRIVPTANFLHVINTQLVRKSMETRRCIAVVRHLWRRHKETQNVATRHATWESTRPV